MKSPLKKILESVISFSMLTPSDHVIVALSGGADSVALLVAMAEIAPRYNLKLSAAHVHHGLRGAEADRDAAFAETITGEIARRYGIEISFYLHHADVKKRAKELKLSTQETGRLVRDAFFRDLIERIGATKIAKPSARRSEIRFGTNSPRMSDAYVKQATNTVRPIPSACRRTQCHGICANQPLKSSTI